MQKDMKPIMLLTSEWQEQKMGRSFKRSSRKITHS